MEEENTATAALDRWMWRYDFDTEYLDPFETWARADGALRLGVGPVAQLALMRMDSPYDREIALGLYARFLAAWNAGPAGPAGGLADVQDALLMHWDRQLPRNQRELLAADPLAT